jgi:hypothetical protein
MNGFSKAAGNCKMKPVNTNGHQNSLNTIACGFQELLLIGPALLVKSAELVGFSKEAASRSAFKCLSNKAKKFRTSSGPTERTNLD